jgi:hypothetical protein
MLVETYTGEYIYVTLEKLKSMTREELVLYLEMRGTACYEDESTDLLRECAIEDWESEI